MANKTPTSNKLRDINKWTPPINKSRRDTNYPYQIENCTFLSHTHSFLMNHEPKQLYEICSEAISIIQIIKECSLYATKRFISKHPKNTEEALEKKNH